LPLDDDDDDDDDDKEEGEEVVVPSAAVLVDYAVKISLKNPSTPCLYIGKDRKVIGFCKLGHILFCLSGMTYNY